jgi:hypothetical protein
MWYLAMGRVLLESVMGNQSNLEVEIMEVEIMEVEIMGVEIMGIMELVLFYH